MGVLIDAASLEGASSPFGRAREANISGDEAESRRARTASSLEAIWMPRDGVGATMAAQEKRRTGGPSYGPLGAMSFKHCFCLKIPGSPELLPLNAGWRSGLQRCYALRLIEVADLVDPRSHRP